MALPITHIGILVADLELTREHWSTALGMPFSPISRYRPTNWSDLGNPTPHLHDARLTFCLGIDPSIEILEFVGNGTHSPSRGEGGHHLAFPPVDDLIARRRELAALGIGVDGEIQNGDRFIFTFSDARELNNVYTEWVEESPAHIDVKDDGSPVDRLPDGTKTLFDVQTIRDLGGQRPWSGIVEFGVRVDSLDAAAPIWSAVTGSPFLAAPAEPADDGLDGLFTGRSLVGTELEPQVRLFEGPAGARQGLTYAVVAVPRFEDAVSRLATNSVPLRNHPHDQAERFGYVDVDPGYLNGFALRLRPQ